MRRHTKHGLAYKHISEERNQLKAAVEQALELVVNANASPAYEIVDGIVEILQDALKKQPRTARTA